jgi:hypothetical protein
MIHVSRVFHRSPGTNFIGMLPSRHNKNRTALRRPNRPGSRRAPVRPVWKHFAPAAHASRPDNALFLKLDLVTDADLLSTETFAGPTTPPAVDQRTELACFVSLR